MIFRLGLGLLFDGFNRFGGFDLLLGLCSGSRLVLSGRGISLRVKQRGIFLVDGSQFLVGHRIVKINGLKLSKRLVHGFGQGFVGREGDFAMALDYHSFAGGDIHTLA